MMITNFITMFFRTKKQSGYVTVLFCCISVLLIGGLYYNVFIANSVKNLIRLQNSSDIASYTLGVKSAKGLNYISVNNVAIASSLHIGGAVPILASYLTLIKAATQNSAQIETDQWSSYSGDHGFQKIWSRLKPLASSYLKIAAGATAFNESLVSSWLGYSLIKAMDIFKKNDHDDGADISFSKETVTRKESLRINRMYGKRVSNDDTWLGKLSKVKDVGSIVKKYKSYINFRYDGLETMNSKDSLCRTFQASQEMLGNKRDDPFYWMIAVLPDNKIGSALSKFHGYLGKIHEYFPYKIGFNECGVSQKAGNQSIGSISAEGGQFQYFKDNNSVKNIGFMSVSDVEKFDQSLSYKAEARSKLSKLSLLLILKHSTLRTNTYVKVVNNEPKNKHSLFYPSWYPILIDELTM